MQAFIAGSIKIFFLLKHTLLHMFHIREPRNIHTFAANQQMHTDS
jgi:hypothetical protein